MYVAMLKWLLAVEMLLSVLGGKAGRAQQIDPVTQIDPEVQLVAEKPGWERAWTHDAMEPLYNASLYPDIAVFKARVRLPSALGIANQLRKYHMNTTRVKRGTAVVVIRNGKVQGVTFDEFAPAFRTRLDWTVNELQKYHDDGHIKLEDTIFIFNARDVPVCTLGYCLVPLFSPIKEIRNGRPYSDDLLVPLMSYPYEALVYYPPDKKIPQGIMAAYKDEAVGSDSSCRALIHRFAREDFMGHLIRVVDADELLRTPKERSAVKLATVSGIVVPPPPPDELSRYSLVMSCDYQTANPGLATLLHTNSLVLKGRSVWYEYYYRAMENGVHYREFEPGYAVEAVKEALKPSSQAKVQEVVEEGMKFAYKYLSQRSRALFYEKAISEYNQLFGPGYMEATVKDLPKRELTMNDILALRMYPSSWRQGLA